MAPSPFTPVGEPDVRTAADALRRRLGADPFAAAIVLGSGLGGVVDVVTEPVSVPFDELPGFPPAGVAGHAGRWIAGQVEGRRVLIQSGRYHRYEGRPRALVTAPVGIASALGIEFLVLTNASGGIRAGFGPGTLAALVDHIDLTEGQLPTANGARGMESPYQPELRALAASGARRVGVPLASGVYAAVQGPSYETRAEIRLLGHLGADLVGMSTAPEAAAARSLGMRCLGLSLVTNWASGIAPGPLAHDEVIEAGRLSAPRFERLLRELVRALPAA